MKDCLPALAHKVPVVYIGARENMQYEVEDIVMEVFFREEEFLVDCGFPQTSYDETVPPNLKQNGSRLQVNQIYIQV